MPYVSYASVAYCSALMGTGIGAAVETMLAAAEGHAFRIPTGELNRIIRDAVDSHPLNDKGPYIKGSLCHDGGSQAPYYRYVCQRSRYASLLV